SSQSGLDIQSDDGFVFYYQNTRHMSLQLLSRGRPAVGSADCMGSTYSKHDTQNIRR
ncbi:unnamed protein product, partial [marine sediment metagenome]